MGDHFDTQLVTPIDDDPRLGVTDLYAFQKPGDPNTSVLILCVSPSDPSPFTGFRPEAVYQINIDTDGDVRTDVAFNITFSAEGGTQTAAVRRATGEAARMKDVTGDVVIDGAAVTFDDRPITAEAGSYRFFAGVRSDPFFADYSGFVNNLQFTGGDDFAGKNVLGIVLEVPNDDLGRRPLGLWARTLVRRDGEFVQVDRAGAPGTNIGFNEGEDMRRFNLLEPAADHEFFDHFVQVLMQRSGYDEGEAKGIVAQILPDVLHYDPSQPAAYPNGRKLEDDPIDMAVALTTKGRITSDLAGPHENYLSGFPYLGPPEQPGT